MGKEVNSEQIVKVGPREREGYSLSPEAQTQFEAIPSTPEKSSAVSPLRRFMQDIDLANYRQHLPADATPGERMDFLITHLIQYSHLSESGK